MNISDLDIKNIYDNIYCSLLEKVIEKQDIINYARKVISRESKLSVNSVKPNTKTQINFLNENQFYGDTDECCRLSGNGRYLWTHRTASYDGEFLKPNVIEGRGIYEFDNRNDAATSFSKYCGYFINNMYHGEGDLENNFFSYKGNFELNKFHGAGSIKTQFESFDGIFENDRKVSGKRVYTNGIFTGDFDENEMRKYGKYNFDNGDCYCGTFKNNLFDGYGEYLWACSESLPQAYCGFWKENYRNGIGMIQINGTCCCTTFDMNSKNGCGIVWAQNGNIYLSKHMFANDEFIECKRIYISRDNVNIVKGLFNIETLKSFSVAHFDSTIELLDQKYSVIDEITSLSLYPFHMNWFDMNVEHDFIWDFVQKFSNTSKEREFASITSILKMYVKAFEKIYHSYAEYSHRILLQTPKHNEMKRIGLWQLFRDLKLFQKSKLFNTQAIIENAEMECNILVINTNNPSETVTMTNFVNYLLYVVLHVNKHNTHVLSCAINQRSKIFGLFATMIVVFIREFLSTMKPLNCGMIPEIILDDKAFFVNFIDIIDFHCQELSICDVFQIIEKLTFSYGSDKNGNFFLDLFIYIFKQISIIWRIKF